MDVAISIVVTFLLTLANGYFSASELAVVSAKRAILEPEAEEGDRRAKAALALSADSGQFLATIQVAITLVGFASAAFASTSLSDPLGLWFESFGVPDGISDALAPVIITLLVSYLSIVVGELVPKRIALADSEGVAKSVSGVIRAFMHVARPFVWLTSKSASGLSTLLGVASADERDSVSEEEIKYMVTDADELSDEEKSMIHEVIELGDTIAREVMVPRVDMTALEDTTTLTEVLAVMRRTGYSRIPIYHESVDRIVGIAHIKDLISPILETTAAPTTPFRRTSARPTSCPTPRTSSRCSPRCSPATTRWSSSSTSTVEPPASSRSRTSSRRSSARSRTSSTPTTSTSRSSEEYETVAGFVLELADKLPHPGDVIEKDGYQFRVQSMRGRRLSMLRVIAPEQPEKDSEDNADGEKDADSSKE